MMENQKKAGDQWVDCFQPLGILWGSHEFTDGKQKHVQPYILSTFLSTVCNLLDVELVRDWNLDTVNTWGSIGHFKIGALACDLVINTSNCFKFLQKNKLNIGYSDDTMQSGDMVNGRYHAGTFVPLADVPDIVWRSLRKVKDGSNHFADMDENFPSVAGGKTLLQLNEDPAFLDIQKWLDFDKKMDIAHPLTKSSKNGPVPAPRRGALPFRVWQSYNWMVKYLKQGDLYQFLVAGGTMSHYLGDACQPLHISYLHHGASAAEIDVHSDYETDMIADHMQELFTLVAGKIKEVKANELISEKGKDAALKVIGLMRDTVTDFPPMTVLESWRKGGSSPKARRDQMWKDLHDQTAATIANGAHVLAILWQSAWKAGNGDAIPAGQLITLDPQKLMELYVAPATVPAYRLDDTAEYTAACY
jgi:hypothetical protein